MANDDVVNQMRLHQQCWELLPWVVNGTLSSAEATRVSEHLRECTRCCEELQAQQRLCEALRQDDSVLLAPQASLKKLWQRVDGAAPLAGHADPDEQDAAAHEPAIGGGHRGDSSWRRLRGVMAAQTLLIVGLLGLVGWQAFERWQVPRFVTVTSPAIAPTGAGSVRVVFATGAVVQDVNALLRSLHAEMLAGPSSAGVFTLGLPAGVNADVAAEQLRSDPLVQFAEAMPAARVHP